MSRSGSARGTGRERLPPGVGPAGKTVARRETWTCQRSMRPRPGAAATLFPGAWAWGWTFGTVVDPRVDVRRATGENAPHNL